MSLASVYKSIPRMIVLLPAAVAGSAAALPSSPREAEESAVHRAALDDLEG
ncbi:MAG: hypothetical protein GYA74_03820 [Acidobacteria bacterium]|nr:hypothetical protein [Acidobacteriota bacterium]HNQ81746.1 hypothetical protein [Candidatus Aminicenantes bacterium]NMD10281.1 hypothetical protein [Acidobacteriota bacterium]HNT33174.1 hypothetical protein [Candidatus Aminicenantes bacterium]HOF81997.1 hypothetical protein [Candidatus Aminicenantes bacterium]